MTRPTRIQAAEYLARYSVFTPEQILAHSDELTAHVVAEVLECHQSCGCEFAVRINGARDVLVGAPIHVEGQLTL